MQEQPIKKKNGGARPGAGRKRKMEEHELIERLYPMAEIAFKVLKEKLIDGDMKALQLYISYFVGLPTQKIESKIEGQLNSVSVEVVRPELVKEEVLSN